MESLYREKTLRGLLGLLMFAGGVLVMCFDVSLFTASVCVNLSEGVLGVPRFRYSESTHPLRGVLYSKPLLYTFSKTACAHDALSVTRHTAHPLSNLRENQL